MSKEPPVLLWSQNNPDGYLKEPAYPGDAGADLSSTEDITVLPGKITKVPCGINVAIPSGYCSLVISRSSLVNWGLMAMTTLIDEGYRGPLFLFVMNFGDSPVEINKGDRLGQLLLLHTGIYNMQVEQVDKLPSSDRGTNSFGSSGGTIHE